MDHWLAFAAFVTIIVGLLWAVLRLMGPQHTRDVGTQHEEAISRYAWGRNIPGWGAFWAAVHGTSQRDDQAPATHSCGDDGHDTSAGSGDDGE